MTDNHEPTYSEVKIYRKRWAIVTLYGVLVLVNNCIWISISAVTVTIEKYYNVSALTIGTVTTSSSLCIALLAIPASCIVSKYGLRIPAIALAGLNALGATIRIGGIDRNQFIFVAIGQLVNSLGTIFALITPPQIAATWFPSNERTFATTFGAIMGGLGVAAGFVMSTCMIPAYGGMDEVGNGIRNMFIIQDAICFILFFAIIEFFQEQPAKPPSISQSFRLEMVEDGQDLPFWNSLVELLRDKDYILVTIAYSFNYCIIIASQAVWSQLMHSSPTGIFSGNYAGWIGLYASCGSIFSSALASVLIDRNKNFKRAACIELLLASFSLVEFALVLHYEANLYVISVSFVIVMVICFPYTGVGLDHLAEIAYPIDESSAAMLPIVLGNVGSVSLVYSAQLTIYYGYKDFVTYGFYGLQGLAFLCCLVAKAPSRRTLTDSIPPGDIPPKPSSNT